jgi:hypothetical protein
MTFSAKYILIAAIFLLLTSAAAAQEPPLSDKHLDDAIFRGVKFLLDGGADGSLSERQRDGGAEALAVSAAIRAGVPVKQPKLAAVLKRLKAQKSDRVYARAMRVLVCSRLGGDFSEILAKDAAWLIRRQDKTGGWGPEAWQTPNIVETALVMRALNEAAHAGVTIPEKVWTPAREFLRKAQNADGGFGYHLPGAKPVRMRGLSHGIATAAGAAALGVLMDRQTAESQLGRTREDIATAAHPADLAAYGQAIIWLTRRYNLDSIPNWYWGDPPIYTYLYSLCQACRTVFPMRLGAHDLDVELPMALLKRQQPDGGFGESLAEDRLVATAYAVLELQMARQPVLLQKLTIGEELLADYNDAANLCRWTRRKFGYDATWRRALPNTDIETLRRSPVLYISGLGKVGPLPEDFAPKIREYLRSGGTILIQPTAGDQTMSVTMEDFFKKLVPNCKSRPVPAGHSLFSDPAKVDGVKIVSFHAPSGPLRVFLLQSDLSKEWRRGSRKDNRPAFDLFGNVICLATDQNWPVHKFSPPEPSLVAPKPTRLITIGRLRPPGDTSRYPAAARRLSETLAEAISVGLKQRLIQPGGPIAADLPLVWMTGSHLRNFRGTKPLSHYLETGGMLLADSADGRQKFIDQTVVMLEGIFGPGSVKPLPADHPLVTGRFADGLGSDITKVHFTPAAVKVNGGRKVGSPKLLAVRYNGRIVAVLSRFSITRPAADSGRTPPDYVGYAPADARRIALNVLLYAIAARQGAL